MGQLILHRSGAIRSLWFQRPSIQLLINPPMRDAHDSTSSQTKRWNSTSTVEPCERSALTKLFLNAEQSFPNRWRANGWYLTVAASLLATGQQRHTGALYSHLISQAAYRHRVERQRLIRRVREALIKCIPLNGIPSVIEAVLSIVEVESPEDQDHTCLREDWQANAENHDRARTMIDTIYANTHGKVRDSFKAHREIAWISTEISYGLFLSEDRILDMSESELVILPAILCQNLRGPTMWHQRGCLRFGITREEVASIQGVAEEVARYGGRVLDNIGTVDDVEDDP